MLAQIAQRFTAVDRRSNGSNVASNRNPNPISLLPQSLLPCRSYLPTTSTTAARGTRAPPSSRIEPPATLPQAFDSRALVICKRTCRARCRQRSSLTATTSSET
jgi:hypothetical protein